jgi:predicted DNA-binding transcriptional regulator AlpA
VNVIFPASGRERFYKTKGKKMEKVVIEAKGLANALGIPRQAILNHRANLVLHPLLFNLPDPIMTRPRLVWLVADIEAWLESRRTFRKKSVESTPPPQPKRGRPFDGKKKQGERLLSADRSVN